MTNEEFEAVLKARPTQTISYQFPLRITHVVQIQGLPVDLTMAEAMRMTQFLESLAMPPHRASDEGVKGE